MASAEKWYNGGGTVEEGALRYLRMNLIEQRVVERAFPDAIFVTFNGSELRGLFPRQLPIFYMYSLRRGMAVKPWFLPAEPKAADVSADQANLPRPDLVRGFARRLCSGAIVMLDYKAASSGRHGARRRIRRPHRSRAEHGGAVARASAGCRADRRNRRNRSHIPLADDSLRAACRLLRSALVARIDERMQKLRARASRPDVSGICRFATTSASRSTWTTSRGEPRSRRNKSSNGTAGASITSTCSVSCRARPIWAKLRRSWRSTGSRRRAPAFRPARLAIAATNVVRVSARDAVRLACHRTLSDSAVGPGAWPLRCWRRRTR